jgi:hypothetical protein
MSIKLTFNTTLGVPTWNIPAGRTCTGRSAWCAEHCYACHGNFLYSNVQAAHARNWAQTEDLETFIADMTAECMRWAAKGHKRIRIHSSGDFYSVDYFRAWMDIANACPDLEFFTYTRTWRVGAEMRAVLSEARDVPNLTLWWSTDESMSADEVRVAEESGSPVAYILDQLGSYSKLMPAPNCEKQVIDGANCASCGKCFHKTQRSVTFIAH